MRVGDEDDAAVETTEGDAAELTTEEAVEALLDDADAEVEGDGSMGDSGEHADADVVADPE